MQRRSRGGADAQCSADASASDFKACRPGPPGLAFITSHQLAHEVLTQSAKLLTKRSRSLTHDSEPATVTALCTTHHDMLSKLILTPESLYLAYFLAPPASRLGPACFPAAARAALQTLSSRRSLLTPSHPGLRQRLRL
jgi:hypothetical protein